jgi:hypothetical protein
MPNGTKGLPGGATSGGPGGTTTTTGATGDVPDPSKPSTGSPPPQAATKVLSNKGANHGKDGRVMCVFFMEFSLGFFGPRPRAALPAVDTFRKQLHR